jgi:hypothetical protein
MRENPLVSIGDGFCALIFTRHAGHGTRHTIHSLWKCSYRRPICTRASRGQCCCDGQCCFGKFSSFPRSCLRPLLLLRAGGHSNKRTPVLCSASTSVLCSTSTFSPVFRQHIQSCVSPAAKWQTVLVERVLRELHRSLSTFHHRLGSGCFWLLCHSRTRWPHWWQVEAQTRAGGT